MDDDQFMAFMLARIAQNRKEEEEKKRNPPESKECFCYICGGPSTSGALLKESEYVPGEYDEYSDHLRSLEFYNDYCDCNASRLDPGRTHDDSCRSRMGYQKQKISLGDLKWLENVRMISHFVDDSFTATEVDGMDLEGIEGSELLTQMGSVNYGRNYSVHDTWSFPSSGRVETFLGKPLGCLVHDACLKVLDDVHRTHFNDSRPFNLREALLVFEVSTKDLDSPDFDWGYEGAFGKWHRLDNQRGNPVENSEWTAMDPQKPVTLQPMISKALQSPIEIFSFRFGRFASCNGADRFSLLPSELRMQLLEMLPTKSVLNLLLASSAFRGMSSSLPQRFWRSRIFTDFSWWQESSLSLAMKTDQSAFPFDKLFYVLREASKENMVLKNRRRIWRNSERIIRDVEARHNDVRQRVGNNCARIPTVRKGCQRLTSYKAIAISRNFQEMPQAVSTLDIAGTGKESGQLTELTAYFGPSEQIIGLEFLFSKESNGRLLGTKSTSTSKVAIHPGSAVIAILVSFGSPEINEKERRIRGLGICTYDSPEKPAYILGHLDDTVVLQIMRADPGMAIVGVAAEFNAETFTTLGAFSAYPSLTPIYSRYSRLDRTLGTQWLGRHPPLHWSVGQISLERPSNGVGGEGRRMRVRDPPIFFVNLRGRQLSQVKALGNFQALQPFQRYPTGIAFFFEDGSNEDIGGVISCGDNSDTQTIDFQVDQAEAIADMRLCYAISGREDEKHYRLCGFQFLTTLNRKLSLGCIETSEHVRGQTIYPLNAISEFGSVCGIQVGFRNGTVECAGLAFWNFHIG